MWLQTSNIMKKITLLFATMLAMSGMGFGQNTLKTLWEKETFIVSSGGYGDPSSFVRVSPNGNLNTSTRPGGSSYFDKNGNKIGLSNLQTPFDENTYPILNKDFEIVGTFDLSKTRKNGWSLNEEEDGILVVNLDNDKTVKYDFNGKEVWRYNHEGKEYYIELKYTKSKDFYFLVQYRNQLDYKAFILNKKGKKIGEINLDYSPDKIFSSNDKSFWILKTGKDIEFTKYDSTGAKIQVIQPKRYSYDDAFIFSPKNSVVMSSISADSKLIFFTRTDTQGNTKIVSKKIDELKDFAQLYDRLKNYTIRIEMIDENKFRFLINSGILSAMGFGSFEDENFGWFREAKNPNMAKNAFITYANNNITSYNLDGTLKWSYSFSGEDYPLISYDPYNNIQEFVYVEYVKDGQYFISKIQIEDGKIIWTQNKKKEETVYIRQDSENNDYLIYRNGVYKTNGESWPPYSYRIIMISKITQKASKYYESPTTDFSSYGPTLLIDFKNKTLVTFPLENLQDGYKFRLRKYSTRCLYDILPQAEATGKTEVCTGEQVKLSTTKQDGLLYQWQKDGKDIPNFKDVTFDVNESGLYTVTVKDEACQNPEISNAIKVTVKPSPEAIISTDIKGVIYEPFTVKMTASTGTNLSYQWLKDEVIIDNATTNIYEAKKSGKYKVSVTKDGCVKTSEALTISIQIPLANEGEIGEESVQIYPNPSRGEFKIILPKTLQNADIQLFDVLGRERKLIHTGEQAQADGLVQGTYFLRVNKGERSVVNKIVIE